jgi:hypothetical protein
MMPSYLILLTNLSRLQKPLQVRMLPTMRSCLLTMFSVGYAFINFIDVSIVTSLITVKLTFIQPLDIVKVRLRP